MNKKLFEIASDIVQAQVSAGPMSPEEIQSTLVKTFATLQKMKRAEDEGEFLVEGQTAEELQGEEKAPEKMSPQESIQNDKITCLECGAEFRQLTARHLASHSLTPREYKKKYGFSLRTPLSARSLTKARSKAAKKRGLPENLVKYREEKRQQKREESLAGSGAMESAPFEAPSMQTALEAAALAENKEAKAPAKRSRKKA